MSCLQNYKLGWPRSPNLAGLEVKKTYFNILEPILLLFKSEVSLFMCYFMEILASSERFDGRSEPSRADRRVAFVDHFNFESSSRVV